MFTALPVEVLEHILSYVDRPSDLLAIALTAKRPCSIVIPFHIQTRHIQCDVRCSFLWTALASSPRIAARIVSLELVFEPLHSESSGVILPAFLFGSEGNDASRNVVGLMYSQVHRRRRAANTGPDTVWIEHLVGAIRPMSALTRFHWTCLDVAIPASVVEALRDSCPSLSDLRLDIVNHQFMEYDESNCSIWDFPMLSRFSLTRCKSRLFDVEHLKAVLEMLIERCPRLEHLQLVNVDLIACGIFEWGRWCHLKTLYITCDPLGSNLTASTVQSFFDHHPGLKRVHISKLGLRYPICYGPNLRALTLGPCQSGLVLGSMTRLEFLSVWDIDPIHPPKYLSNLPALRSLVIDTVPLAAVTKHIKRYFPYLERLHMIWPFGVLERRDVEDEDSKGAFEQGCEFLESMRRLTHLSHFADMLRVPEELIGVVVGRFAIACPTLVYVELRCGITCRWITVERDERDGKSYTGWHYTKRKRLRGVLVEGWNGDFYAEDGCTC